VDTKELESIPVTNVGQALQGRAAGVTVMQNDGNPGSGLLVQVRGAGSVNSIQPLFVIDGVIGAGGENYINPGDIESIQVLKDASASAIYGSRAANGVVLITTKRGKAGKPRVSFDSYYGIQNVWKKIDVLNARQYADYANELQANGGQPSIPALQNPETLVDRTDWQDEIFRTAPIQNYNVGVSGGSENATFNVKAGYFNQEGILLRTGFDRYSLRINSDFRVGKFKFGESLNLAKTTNRGSTPEALAQSIAMPTYIPVYNPSTPGQFAGPNVEDGMDAKNPVRILTLNDTRTDGYSLIGNAFMDYEILKNLVYRFSGGLSFEVSDYSSYTPAYSAGERDVAPFANLNQSNARNLTPLIENTLTYSNSFGEHTITALAGYTRQWFNGKYTSAGIRNFISPDVQVINGGTEIQNLTGNVQEWSLVSFLARVSYDYRGKYLLTTNFRRDGSSRFAPGNKYGVFPSFSVGWRAGQEAFLSDVGWLSDLKFRFGWGQIGNQDPYNGGNNYPYQATLNANGNYILGSGQQKVPAITQTALANANISWETSVQTNFGVDLGLWKNKLTLNADYYVKKTQDMLIGLPIPVSSGLGGEPTFNSGAAVNTGFEVSGTLNQTIGAFTFSLGANMGYLLRNEVTSLGDRSQPLLIDALIVQRTLPGQSMGHFYGYRVDRIYQTKEEIDADNAVAAENGKGYYQGANTAPGDIRFKDLNGDGTVNADDREVIGNPIPKLTYGATLGMGYKGFDLSLMLQGMGGYDVFNFYNAYWNESMSRAFNTTTAVLDRWTRSNPSTTFPRAVANDPNGNARGSDRWIENGSFMRVKNLTIGYALPAGLLGAFIKGSVSSLRIYATSQNLLTFSDNSFWDPEFASGGSSINYRGIAGSVYPQARTFLVGIQAGF
jgi:TonB-linked SusC/RagA family outer membrane protein